MGELPADFGEFGEAFFESDAPGLAVGRLGRFRGGLPDGWPAAGDAGAATGVAFAVLTVKVAAHKFGFNTGFARFGGSFQVVEGHLGLFWGSRSTRLFQGPVSGR